MAKPKTRWKHRTAGPKKYNGAIIIVRIPPVPKRRERAQRRLRIECAGFTLADVIGDVLDILKRHSL